MLDLDPRRIFTPKQCAEIFQNSGGKCDLCGRKLFKRADWTCGHVIAHALGGPTTVENAQVECNETCAKETHKEDTGRSAKARRQGGETGQQARRRRNGSQFGIPGMKKQIDGKVVPRD
ncbi:MAG: HNH endonuclease [Desulfobacteraceae bacterium]|nr:HNH endonuclease [Desulfobacteraceae bacterium]